MSKLIVAVAAVIATLVAGLGTAEARHSSPAASCERGAIADVEFPVELGTFEGSRGNGSGFVVGHEAFRGESVTKQTEMSGLIFDGFVNDPPDFWRPWPTVKQTTFAIQYQLPAAPCDRVASWGFDAQLTLPNGARTLGDPWNNLRIRVGVTADPTGAFNVVNVFSPAPTVWRRLVEGYQFTGTTERMQRRYGQMTIPAGRRANLFVFVLVAVKSWGGKYCIGSCRWNGDISSWGQEGSIDFLVPGWGQRSTGIEIRTSPLP